MNSRFFRPITQFQSNMRFFQTLAPLVGMDDTIAIFETNNDKRKKESSDNYQTRSALEMTEAAWPFSLDHTTPLLCVQLQPTYVMPIKQDILESSPHVRNWPVDNKMGRLLLPYTDADGNMKPGKESIYPGHVATVLGSIGPGGLIFESDTLMSKISLPNAKKTWYPFGSNLWSYETKACYQGQTGEWNEFFFNHPIVRNQEAYVKQIYILINFNVLDLSHDVYMARLKREINDPIYDIMRNACGQSVMRLIMGVKRDMISPQTAVFESISALAINEDVKESFCDAFKTAEIYDGNELGMGLTRDLNKDHLSAQSIPTLT